MIKGKCKTNIDNYTMIVDVFASVPNKGDSVAVMYNGKPNTLKVIDITHSITTGQHNVEPYIIVELHY